MSISDHPFTWTCPWCGIGGDHESPGVAFGPYIAHPMCAMEMRDQMDADALETEIQRAQMVADSEGIR